MVNYLKLLSLLFVFSVSKLFSQNNVANADDASRISLTVYIPNDKNDLDETSKNSLNVRLNRIISNYGMSSGFNSRFIITAKVVEQSKEISATSPAYYLYDLETTLFIGDGISGKIFANYTLVTKGTGISTTKAYLNAISKIKDKDPAYKEFIDNAKSSIISYYNSQCDFILKDAEALAGTKGFDEAIYKLSSVPDVCKDCYNKCLDKITEVYKAKIENECQQNIAQAKTFIAQNNYNDAAAMLSSITPDMQCYSIAESVIKDINDHKCAVSLGEAKGFWVSHDIGSTSMALSSIPSDSKCYSEAMVLAKEVEKYVKETEKRDFEVMKQQMKNEQDSKMATIKSARDIGVAYGSNQPKTITTYNIRGWW